MRAMPPKFGQFALWGFALPISAIAVASGAAATDAPDVANTQTLPTVVAPEERAGVIFERQQIMLELEKDTDLLGRIVAGRHSAVDLAAITRNIAENARASAEAFRPRAPGGRSKPEVWSNWSDYADRMDRFARNAQTMATLGERGDVSAVTAILGEALPCKQCHDIYRNPKSSDAQ